MGDSKRIPFAVPGPSTRINVPGARVNGPQIITGSQQPTYNSAISDTWNNHSSSSSSSAVPSSKSISSELRTTCLFCPSLVIIQGGLPNESPQVLARRNKLLKNVCFHLQVDANELPTNGTKLQFPFCSDCDKIIEELLEYQETLETIKEKMAKHVGTLERIIIDKEILGSEPMSDIERQKFVRLYDMILKAYRNKLRRQKELKNNLYCQESSENQNQPTFSPVRLLQFHGQFPSSSISRNGFETDQDNNNMNVSVDPLVIGAEVGVEEDANPSSSPDNMEGEEEEQSYNNYFENEGDAEDAEWNCEQSTNANVKNRKLLTISNVQSAASTATACTTASALTKKGKRKAIKAPSSSGGSRGRGGNSSTSAAAKKIKHMANKAPSASAATGRNDGNPVEIKQEVLAKDDDDNEEEEEGDATSVVPERKRRLLFKGVEIVKCNGTRKTKNDEFLQCSACPFTLPILKLTRKEAKESPEMSPYVKIKMHIQNVHTDNPGPLKPRATPQFVCGPCNITFPNLATLRDHNRTHPVPEALPCDICGRPIKGGHFNLQLHKFSHKNDEERRISLANNERGSYRAFLAAKLTSLYNPTKKSRRSGNSSSATRNGNKGNRSRNVTTSTARKPSSSTSTTAAAITESNNGIGSVINTPTPINTAATRSTRAARRRGSTTFPPRNC